MNKTAFVGLMIVSTLCLSRPSHAQSSVVPFTVWIGPHLNLHFGEHGSEGSLGVEASVWGGADLADLPVAGADFGIEYHFSRDIWVKYLEFQVGIGVAGVSVGVVSDGEYGAGLQASLWANMIGGAMVRFRQFGGANPHGEGSIGAYVKAPYMGLSNSTGEEQNPPQETSSDPGFDFERFGVEEGDLDVAEGIR